jgi:hypothetical protein
VGTLIVPIVSTFAAETWRFLGAQISLLDERVRPKKQRSGGGSFSSNQIGFPSVETMPSKNSDEVHDFNRRSQVRLSTFSNSPQQDVR